jgi:hypothetical protein
MYYELNISLNGRHFFATAERSITSEDELKKVYDVLKVKFPHSEGYRIGITRWETTGTIIKLENEIE